MKRTTITIPKELSRIVEDEARRRNTSVSAIVRMALERTFYPAGERAVGFAAICDSSELPPGRSLDEALDEWEDELDRGRR